jgi:beta-phosphoglucomutase-like phosphatase (HAD superfamily)
VVAAGDVPYNKPHPAPLERVAELLGLDVERLALVATRHRTWLADRAPET